MAPISEAGGVWSSSMRTSLLNVALKAPNLGRARITTQNATTTTTTTCSKLFPSQEQTNFEVLVHRALGLRVQQKLLEI